MKKLLKNENHRIQKQNSKNIPQISSLSFFNGHYLDGFWFYQWLMGMKHSNIGGLNKYWSMRFLILSFLFIGCLSLANIAYV